MRSKSEIDFSVVDDMLEAGCTGEEVAARLGIHADTLYNRIKEETNLGFSAYRQQKVAMGDQILREKMYGQAKGGNTTMLIFLGKTRLGMSEKVEVDIPAMDNLARTVVNIAFRAPSDAQSIPIESKRSCKNDTSRKRS